MTSSRSFLHLTAVLLIANGALAWAEPDAPAPQTGPAAQPAPVCSAPAEMMRLQLRLKRTGQRIAAGQSLTIVAIGSSSTYGAGASSQEQAYPSRLAVELKTL